MACCKLQWEQGGYFLHERPKESTSWQEPEVQEMVERKDTYLVQSPMCKFGVKMENRILWLTNSTHIAEELEGVCINKLKGREVHRRVHLIGRDRAKAAQVYPVPLVEAILRGLKKELVGAHALSAEEEQYMDDVSGAGSGA